LEVHLHKAAVVLAVQGLVLAGLVLVEGLAVGRQDPAARQDPAMRRRLVRRVAPIAVRRLPEANVLRIVRPRRSGNQINGSREIGSFVRIDHRQSSAHSEDREGRGF